MTDKKNNFEKDINVPSKEQKNDSLKNQDKNFNENFTQEKEQIIINGEPENCKILFRCKHINDLKAYDMIRNGIKITPENAPVGDFDLMLIENTDSPFGFSSVCKRNSKENVWEYSGFGHSGACSIVTALLKQLARKTQELEVICKAFDIEYAYNDDGKIFGRSNKLRSLEQECEELRVAYNKAQDILGRVNGANELKSYSLQESIKECERYRKALAEIEQVINNILSSCLGRNTVGCRPAHNVCGDLIKILDIINKAKG